VRRLGTEPRRSRQALEGYAIPAAHELGEAGGSSGDSRNDGELAWFWTSRAETALELGALTTGHSPN
jgi:hypothetical protein